MELKPLTDQQNTVLSFMEDYSSEHGFPPTLREIGDAIGLKNINAVRGHVLALEKKGYITKTPDRARSIQIIHSPSTVSRLKRKMHQILRTNKGVFHQVVYGLAWTTRRRVSIFTGQARDWMTEAIDREGVKRGWSLLQKRIEKDHIVLVVKTWPNHSPEQVVRRLQAAGRSAKRRYPESFPGKALWGKGYIATTSLELMDEMVTQLLENQDVKRES